MFLFCLVFKVIGLVSMVQFVVLRGERVEVEATCKLALVDSTCRLVDMFYGAYGFFGHE